MVGFRLVGEDSGIRKAAFADTWEGNYHDSFIFVNLQPVSLIKSTIKAIQAIPDSNNP